MSATITGPRQYISAVCHSQEFVVTFQLTKDNYLKFQPEACKMMSSTASSNGNGKPSNYEIIREGNHVKYGLSYPLEFISDIKQRQNRHKESERERRNRLHAALTNLQKRLPPESSSVWKDQKRPNLHQSICKAATVEAAIAYISLLEQELEQLKNAS